MKFDLTILFDDLREVPTLAREAEALGADGLWASETKHDPFLPLAIAAEHTERLALGTAIAVAFPRSPMILAHVAWDLAEASGGRFILGLGTQVKGHNERRFSVKWSAPGPRLREVVLALHAIWDCWQNGTPLQFRGEHYAFTLMTPFFNPGPIHYPKIPIYLAAINPYNCRLVGELADGISIHPCPPGCDALRARVHRDREKFQRAGTSEAWRETADRVLRLHPNLHARAR